MRDKADEKCSLSFYYVNKVLHGALTDTHDRPWGGVVLLPLSESGTMPERHALMNACERLDRCTNELVGMVDYLNERSYRKPKPQKYPFGDEMLMAISCNFFGLAYQHMDVSFDGSSVFFKNNVGSISIRFMGSGLYLSILGRKWEWKYYYYLNPVKSEDYLC